VVVSNAHIKETFLNLVGKKNIDKNFANSVEKVEYSFSAFKQCLGINIKPEIQPHTIICPCYDIEGLFSKVKYIGNGDSYVLISTPSLLDPSLSTKGHCMQ